MALSIVIVILIFGLVIFVHELGHFLAARSCGVLVEEFALGMGPVLISKTIGETQYSLRALPIGGFCKMYGDEVDPMRKKKDGERRNRKNRRRGSRGN
jgi:regulator of sigma E protease